MSTALLVSLVSLSGCTSNQTQNQSTNDNVILGTWRGTTQITGGFQRNNTTAITVSQVTFRDNDLELTLESQRGAFTMNYTYAFTGDSLVLQPVFSGTNPFGGQPPFNRTRHWNGTGEWNGTRPPGNGTWQSNGTGPFNGTMPSNWTRPGNGSQFPGDRRSFMQVSMTYAWDEQTQTLYLNGSPFTKVP